MLKRYGIPNFWVHLSEQEQLENLRYLLEHYKEYEIKLESDNCICIGRVKIRRFDFKSVMDDKSMVRSYIVNQAVFVEKEYVNLLDKLFDACIAEATQQKDKQYSKIKNKKIAEWVAFGCCLVVGFGTATWTVIDKQKEAEKTKKLNKQVEQYEKSLPNYDEYAKTKKQIANYRDSLQNIKTK